MSGTFIDPRVSPRLGAALERLDALVDWERWERFRGSSVFMRVSVEPMEDLARRLGRPERSFRHVHVAGTKGKGSTSALIAAGLRRAGLRTGIYASPHVERVNERVSIDGQAIADDALAEALEPVLEARDDAVAAGSAGAQATWFDVLTGAAFVVFREARVDWAVIECGLGGRLDSTNVLQPGPCVITNIDLEHTAILGSTRAAIALEKAGIVKPGGFVVSGVGPSGDEAADVVRRVAAERGARHVSIVSAAGESLERRNVALAGAVLDELGRGELARLRVGGRIPGGWLLDPGTIAAARLPGRLESFVQDGVRFVLDGAHVVSSLRQVLAELERWPELGGRKPVVIFGTGREKDAGGLLKVLLGGVDRVLCTTAGRGPYRSPGELLEEARRVDLEAEAHETPELVLARARELTAPGGWVLVTGSLHLVGAIRSLLRTRATPCSRSSPT